MPVVQLPYALGWKPALPGQSLHPRMEFEATALPLSNPRFAQFLPPIWDQANIGSCTAHGTLRAYLYAAAKAGATPAMLSRLMLYYESRDAEGTTQSDAGAIIADVIQVLQTAGVCPETEWPYNTASYTVRPAAQCYADAVKHEVVKAAQVSAQVDQIKAALASGYPVIIGFTCYPGLQSAATAQSGDIPMPGPFERPIGGHCVTCNGKWDDAQQRIGIDNSWSPRWGIQGTGSLPYAYFASGLVSDCHIIYSTTDDALPIPTPPGPNPVPPSPIWNGKTIDLGAVGKIHLPAKSTDLAGFSFV